MPRLLTVTARPDHNDIPLYDDAYTLDSHPEISYEFFAKPLSKRQWHEWWVDMAKYEISSMEKPLNLTLMHA